MRKIFKQITFALMTGVLALSSCSQGFIDPIENTQKEVVTTYLNGTIDKAPETRVNINDGGEVLELTWEAGDQLVIYNSNGNLVGAFTIDESGHGLKSAQFSTTADLNDSEEYSLIYAPEGFGLESNLADMRVKVRTTIVTQNGSGTTDHLKGNLLMETTYRTSDNDVWFSHHMTLLTLNITAPSGATGTPTLLRVGNGPAIFRIKLNNIDWSSPFQAHIFIDPYGQVAREMAFMVETSANENYFQKVTSNKLYVEGYRYTGAVKAMERAYTLANVPKSLTSNTSYTIVDEWATQKSDFKRLRDAIHEADSGVTLEFPFLVNIPEGALNSGIIWRLNALNTVKFPRVENVGKEAFASCLYINTLDLGSYHHSENVALGANIFYKVFGNKSKNIDLTLSKVEESKVNGNTWNGYTFKSITIRETYP